MNTYTENDHEPNQRDSVHINHQEHVLVAPNPSDSLEVIVDAPVSRDLPVITGYELDPEEQTFLESHLSQPLHYSTEETISLESVKEHPETTHLIVFVYSQVTPEIIEALPNLQAIFTMSTGYDHIDTEACAKRDISIHNVPTYGNITVAEHTFALILTLSRRIYESIQRTNGLNFNPEGLTGFDLARKTLGIIGMGKIGSHVAHIARGFQMNILAYDPYPREGLDTELGFTYVSLESLLSQSDIISLHTAYRPETHHIISSANIETIKPGAYLINTARGPLVETKALLHGLDSGILAGAGLDVLEEECTLREERQVLSQTYQATCDLTTVLHGHMLIKDPRVVVTPHNGFNSVEAIERINQTTVENIIAQLEGELNNIVS